MILSTDLVGTRIVDIHGSFSYLVLAVVKGKAGLAAVLESCDDGNVKACRSLEDFWPESVDEATLQQMAISVDNENYGSSRAFALLYHVHKFALAGARAEYERALKAAMPKVPE